MDSKRKVCMIVQNPMVKGGIAAVVNGYYGSEVENRYDVTYIQSYNDGSKFKKLGIAIMAYYKYLINMFFNRPDIVHLHTSFGASFYRQIPFIYIANFFNISVVNHIHGPEFDKFYEHASSRKQRLIRRIYGKCKYIITLSDEWKQKFLKVVPDEKIRVIENYSCIAENVDRKERKQNRVLFLGTIIERKGCFDIPQIVVEVAKVIPDVKFVIAGDGELDKLKSMVNKDGIEMNCEFPGWIRGVEKDKQLRECSLFFLPSYNEGMPMAVLDAMGYGLPIVSTTVGGIPKIVHDEQNGFLRNPGDICGMADAIIELLNNKYLNIRMSNASLKIVEEKYSLKMHLDKLFDVYEEALRK